MNLILHLRRRRWSAVIRSIAMIAAVCLVAASGLAEKTQTWAQDSIEDFLQGTAKNISIRSDGQVTLAPRFVELYSAPDAYLWAVVQDSNGNVFTAGGPDATVYRIAPDGKTTKFFTTNALAIQALAVDSAGNLYAATSPDTKIYKITPSGESALLYDPEANYIWGLAFDSRGNLFVATGDEGRVYRVTPAGEGSLFFETEETHARRILIDSEDNLILGTDPSGLVLRVSNPRTGSPRGFVLHQSPKKEITALALGSDQTIYAAGVGTRNSQPAATPAPAQVSSAPSAPAAPMHPPLPGGPESPEAQPVTVAPQATARPAAPSRIVGGSEIYRIRPDGEPQVIWRSGSDVVYDLALDQQGKLLAATGDQGKLLRIESDRLYTLVLTTSASQITAVRSGTGGKIFVATSNISGVYQLGPELETEGSLESDVFDAEIFSEWGRLEWRGQAASPASISVATRSGNLSSPHRNWSPWSEPVAEPAGRTSASPAARFAQWKAVLKAPLGGASPLLESVTLYYLPRNVAPVISTTEVTPLNYDFISSAVTVNPRNLALPPLSGRPARQRRPQSRATILQTMRPAKGFVGVRWRADDANEDDLSYRIEIRGDGEENWKLLEEETSQDFLSWDSTSFADGIYEVRVTASDAPSNAASEIKTASETIEGILIDNTAPLLEPIRASREGERLRVSLRAADATSKITRAEYSLDGGEWKPVLPATRLFDSMELAFDFATEPVAAGEHTLAVRVYDEHDNLAIAKSVVK
jgi:hypothetical protein